MIVGLSRASEGREARAYPSDRIVRFFVAGEESKAFTRRSLDPSEGGLGLEAKTQVLAEEDPAGRDLV